ncbi:MAG: DUF4242 domain-containing protein [SAR324 cluster bacterium]|nr:DUF4242 domain-containing protein [SAR324 cluster bacterium]
MTVYMVERNLKGITMDQLGAAQKRAIETSAALTAEGQQVRYIRTTFIPGEDKAMCLFEAASPELVEQCNRRAEIPFDRVVEAMDLTP